MSLPDKLVVKNYRCFTDFELELRPLTLLCGPNGGGKSSLLEAIRIVGMLADGKVEGYVPAGELVRRIRGLSENKWKPFGIELHWGEKDVAKWELESHRLVGGIIRRRLSLSSPDVSDRIKELQGKVSWLGAGRRSFIPRVLTEEADKEEVKPDGSGADETVFFRGDGRGLTWWREQLGWVGRRMAFRGCPGWGGWGVNRTVMVPGRRILRGRLPEEVREEEFIDLASAGMGINSVLSVVAGIVHAEQRGGVFAAEEPERSLDGAMQRELAELVCEVVMTENPPRLVMETRSEIMILAIQLAIAKHPELRHRAVTYWVEPDREETGRSYGYKVTYDSCGRPGGLWPDTGLSEEKWKLAGELLDVQTGGEDSGD